MQRCDFRFKGECSCRPGECVVAPMRPIMDTSETPLILFTAQHFVVALLVSGFFAFIGWGALNSANEGYRKQALVEQENVNVAHR